MQNADIVLNDVRVPEANRLQNANSFRETAAVLRLTRAEVAWAAVGNSIGAYEAAVKYGASASSSASRSTSTSSSRSTTPRCSATSPRRSRCARASREMLDEGTQRDEHAALAKEFTTSRMRETVAWARESMGGNGIVLDNDVIRHFADAEAMFSYEGTREMNTLIVGRAITGKAAFV